MTFTKQDVTNALPDTNIANYIAFLKDRMISLSKRKIKGASQEQREYVVDDTIAMMRKLVLDPDNSDKKFNTYWKYLEMTKAVKEYLDGSM